MSKVKTLIVDDEPLAQKVLQKFVGQVDSLALAGVCSNAIEASNALRKQSIDLLFLDIKMPELSGLELLKILKNPPNVILTTAYAEHALESYEFGVIDYLIKPIAFDRFLKAIDKVIPAEQMDSPVPVSIADTKARNFLFVKSDRKIFKVNFTEIRYLEAYGNYVKVHALDKTIIAQETLTQLEGTLPKDQFLRIHKSYLVAIHFIHSLEGNRLFIGDTELPIGQTFKLKIDDILKMK
jgi:DNA-binding LytR/AlgR family response regulator